MMSVLFVSLVWLALAAAFVVLEGLNFTMVNLRFAVGAAAAFLVSIFAPVLAQVIVFGLVSALSTPLLRRREGMDRFVGRTGRVVVSVCQGMPGRVQVGSCILRARCNAELPAGTVVQVEEAEGDVLVVSPVQQRRVAKAAA